MAFAIALVIVHACFNPTSASWETGRQPEPGELRGHDEAWARQTVSGNEWLLPRNHLTVL